MTTYATPFCLTIDNTVVFLGGDFIYHHIYQRKCHAGKCHACYKGGGVYRHHHPQAACHDSGRNCRVQNCGCKGQEKYQHHLRVNDHFDFLLGFIEIQFYYTPIPRICQPIDDIFTLFSWGNKKSRPALLQGQKRLI